MWLTEISTTSLRVASAWGEYTGQELLTVSHSNLIERNNAQRTQWRWCTSVFFGFFFFVLLHSVATKNVIGVFPLQFYGQMIFFSIQKYICGKCNFGQK